MRLLNNIIDFLLPPPLASQIVEANGSAVIPMVGSGFRFGDRNGGLVHEAHIFRNVYVWPRYGAVMTVAGELIARTLYDSKRSERVRRKLRKYPSKKIRGYVTSIEFLWSGANHYHQLVDLHSRLWSLRHLELARIPVTLIHTYEWNEEYKKLIRAIAPNVSLLKVSERCVFHCENYIHLPFLSKSLRPDLFEQVTSMGYLPEEFIEFHKAELPRIFPSERAFSDRLYVGRPSALKRRLKNEAELVRELEKIGFEFLDLSNLTLADQFCAFRRAKNIIAIHGAGMANVLAAHNNPWYLEMFPSRSNLLRYRYLAPAGDLGLIKHDVFCGDGSDIDDDFVVAVDGVLAKVCSQGNSVD